MRWAAEAAERKPVNSLKLFATRVPSRAASLSVRPKITLLAAATGFSIKTLESISPMSGGGVLIVSRFCSGIGHPQKENASDLICERVRITLQRHNLPIEAPSNSTAKPIALLTRTRAMAMHRHRAAIRMGAAPARMAEKCVSACLAA
jgi:hypothetical protein